MVGALHGVLTCGVSQQLAAKASQDCLLPPFCPIVWLAQYLIRHNTKCVVMPPVPAEPAEEATEAEYGSATSPPDVTPSISPSPVEPTDVEVEVVFDRTEMDLAHVEMTDEQQV
jgi:hypothetical protein